MIFRVATSPRIASNPTQKLMKQKIHRLLSLTLGLAGALAVSLARADTN